MSQLKLELINSIICWIKLKEIIISVITITINNLNKFTQFLTSLISCVSLELRIFCKTSVKNTLELFGQIDAQACFKLMNSKEAVFEINIGAVTKK